MSARPLTLIAAALLALAACGGPQTDAEDLEAAPEALTHPPRHLYSLRNAPFAGNPNALVHLGAGFRPAGPLNLVIHFHGWSNCIQNDVEARGAPCRPGGPVRVAHDLIGQLDRSGANAALVAVERAAEQQSSSPGRLVEPGLLRAMVLELLPHVGALAGRAYGEADLGRVVLSSHSGGYAAVAMALDRGGLADHVSQVILLDSLYGNTAEYDAWVRGAPGQRRIAVVYTGAGGTKANSQAMAVRAKGWAQAAGLPAGALLDDRTTATLADAAFDAPLIFKASGLSHDGVAGYYLSRLVAHAGLR